MWGDRVIVRNVYVCLSLGVALGAPACSFDSDPLATSCVEGQQASCNCGGERLGLQRCRADSTFAPCVCSPVDGDSPGGSSQEDAAAQPDPGTSGSSAGASAAAGSTANAGRGAAGTSAASGSGGSGAGSAGMTGAAGQGGNAGTSGGAGSAAGASAAGDGGDGGGGAGGDGGDGGNSGPGGGAPEPGEPYSECVVNEDCDPGLICAINTQLGQSAGYCTSFCDSMNGGECPQPPSGTVIGMCLSWASVCVLGNCSEASCPDGMECVQQSASSPFGPTRNCEYSSSHDNGP